MKSLCLELESMNSQVIQDNKRILQMLSSVVTWKGRSSPKDWKEGKLEDERRCKTPSIVTSTSKKIRDPKTRNVVSNSIKTIKRLKSTESAIPLNRCSSCKLLKKSSEKSIHMRRQQKKDYGVGKETNIMKLKKLSEKIIPKVSSKLIYAKKTQITHFEQGFY